jgi:hypothetical protein
MPQLQLYYYHHLQLATFYLPFASTTRYFQLQISLYYRCLERYLVTRACKVEAFLRVQDLQVYHALIRLHERERKLA